MPLEGACAESFASLRTAFVANICFLKFWCSFRAAWLLETKVLCLYLQGEWETPLGLLSFVSKLFSHHSLTSLAGCFREVVSAIR